MKKRVKLRIEQKNVNYAQTLTQEILNIVIVNQDINKEQILKYNTIEK